MPRNKFYCQCRMRRPVEGGHQEMTSWIPSDIARVGNVVNLKEWPSDKEFSKGWEIIYAGPKRPGDLVEARAEGYKKQRGQSDAYRDGEGAWETPDRQGKKELA